MSRTRSAVVRHRTPAVGIDLGSLHSSRHLQSRVNWVVRRESVAAEHCICEASARCERCSALRPRPLDSRRGDGCRTGMADGEPIAAPRATTVARTAGDAFTGQITLGVEPHDSESPLREVDASASRNLAGGILNATSAVVEALVNRAAGSSGVLAPSVAAGVGAVHGGASLYGLAFADSEIDPQHSVTESLTATVLANMVREGVTLGESFYLPEVRRGHAFLLPMSGVTVNGASPDWETWTYEGQVNRPDHSIVGRYSARRVIHVQWSYDATRPWIGISPLQQCSL